MRYITIDHEITEEDEQIAWTVINDAKSVLAYVGSSDDARNNVGKLNKYYMFTDERSFQSVSYDIHFITAETGNRIGYIWVTYFVQRFNSDSELVYSAGDPDAEILCCWKIQKEENNHWVVTEITEAV